MPPTRIGDGPGPVPPVTSPPERPETPAAPAAATPVAAATDAFDSGRIVLAKGHLLAPAQLALLAKTSPELARSVREAEVTYARLVDQGARLVVTTSAGNGGLPVLAIIPPSLAGNVDPAAPYQVQVHYHGMMGRASQPNPSSPSLARIAATFAQTPPTVFVLPEWRGVNDWSNVRNTETTVHDALAGLAGTCTLTTVSAHSLGRRAIESAIAHGGLVADRLDIEDAFYRTQPEGPRAVATWIAAHPEAQVRILLTTHGAMSDKKTIQSQAHLPDRLFVDQGSEENHWDAELKPW